MHVSSALKALTDTVTRRATIERSALYGRERPVVADHFSFRCHFCFSERSWMAFDVAHYDGMLRAWGWAGRGDCDMAGLHPSKGCRGQTFSCPWPRTPGGAGLMAARSKHLALPGQKPAPSWKMWIEGLLCLGLGGMRSEKTDLCWELDCVWTLSLSQPVGRRRPSGRLWGGGRHKKENKIKKGQKREHHHHCHHHHHLSGLKKKLSHRGFKIELFFPPSLKSQLLNWQEIEYDKSGV